MKTKPEIMFDEFGDWGGLCITWGPGPYGDAIEALNEDGVGFFAPNGELLSVEFDHIDYKNDRQFLEFKDYRVEVVVKNWKAVVKVLEKKGTKHKAA